ncbi:MAG: hypothetical protein HY738_10500 [Bacteroidia bacterium]|nr:hypothetical protein [Bacteroidia bacterium]
MGKTFTKVKIWNFKTPSKKIEFVAQVDNGATTVVLPKELSDKLKFEKVGDVWVKYANEKVEKKEKVIIGIEIMGRKTGCGAIIEPKRKTALIGQIVLEDLDLLIDSKKGILITNPESPDVPLLDAL